MEDRRPRHRPAQNQAGRLVCCFLRRRLPKPLLLPLVPSVRLQRYLAEAGVASRRASEEIIVSGRVSVNGRVVKELGTKVDPAQHVVAVDGRAVKPRRKLYVALNKPSGYICSRKDESSRHTVFDLLPVEWNNLFPVGRLDLKTEGLLFLTNDGQFSLQLTHPRYAVPKTYVALVEGKVEEEMLDRFRKGISEGGETLRAQKTRVISATNRQSVIELELTEGKNREVRRLFESQGLTVLRLERVKIGSIKVGELPSGKWRTLTEAEIKSLLCRL